MADLANFQATVWRYYRRNGRHDLPWRQPEVDGTFDAYKIVVSEIMLQQTQVSRVTPKYAAFLQAFPTVHALAAAPLSEVLTLWSGLGYNRRAKFLWQTAGAVVTRYGGHFPSERQALVSLPGIGHNTAGAVMTYAYNAPEPFIETNIRTVFIHHFFADQTAISDVALQALVDETMPVDSPREWFWALMDYGAYLKQTVGNLSRASSGYIKQSTFHGSRRQIRGQVLRLLIAQPLSSRELQQAVADVRLEAVLQDLLQEGLIVFHEPLFELQS